MPNVKYKIYSNPIKTLPKVQISDVVLDIPHSTSAQSPAIPNYQQEGHMGQSRSSAWKGSSTEWDTMDMPEHNIILSAASVQEGDQGGGLLFIISYSLKKNSSKNKKI